MSEEKKPSSNGSSFLARSVSRPEPKKEEPICFAEAIRDVGGRVTSRLHRPHKTPGPA